MTILDLWAKKSELDPTVHHPLLFHMLDVALVAYLLWDRALGHNMRERLQAELGLDPQETRILLSYWVGLHDIGKASQCFQRKSDEARLPLESKGFEFPSFFENHPHGPISYAVLTEILPDGSGTPLARSVNHAVALTLGGHHGSFPIPTRKPGPRSIGSGEKWESARANLLLELANLVAPDGLPVATRMPESSFFLTLAGFTCVSDWIGSNQDHFIYEPDIEDPPTYLTLATERAKAAVEDLGWHFRPLKGSASSFSCLFPGLPGPRPLQQIAEQVSGNIGSTPGLVIIEAPMGEGKTEAAMLIAEHWNRNLGQQGIYFALPTQATSNLMHRRITQFLREYFSDPTFPVNLVHGNAILGNEPASLSVVSNDETQPNTTVGHSGTEWFLPKKRALLTQFGVGTIDQALLSVMQTKHFFVRLFGLSNKTVILDEIHAYDVYMTTLLERLITWLQRIGTSVILLSATLPASKREALMRAYNPAADSNNSQSYPRITWTTENTSGTQGFIASKRQTLNLTRAPSGLNQLVERLRPVVENGGCVCVIRNTVRDAQETYRALRDSHIIDNGDLYLLHSRFPYDVRELKESQVTDKFGPAGNRPEKAIVVGTQVLEQSLDLDFDLMVTDHAPADLVLQRAGRLHRHESNSRPPGMVSPNLWIIEPEIDGESVPDFGPSGYVYDRYILLRSYIVLNERHTLQLPDDIEEIVNNVYEETDLGDLSSSLTRVLEESKSRFEEVQARDRLAAENNLIGPAAIADNPIEFLSRTNRELDEDDPDIHRSLRALTRLTGPSVSAVCLEDRDGETWIPGHGPVDMSKIPTGDVIRALLRRSISITDYRLVFSLIRSPVPGPWKHRASLKHHRVCVFNEGQAQIGDHWITLDDEFGLRVDPALEFSDEVSL